MPLFAKTPPACEYCGHTDWARHCPDNERCPWVRCETCWAFGTLPVGRKKGKLLRYKRLSEDASDGSEDDPS